MRKLILIPAALSMLWSVTQAANEVSPPASEWRSYCQSYIKALDGDTTASDLDITYCLGVTKGLLNGMRIGSQLGALSFGSRLAVNYKLDPDEVFKLFQAQDPSRLLGICAPSTQTTPDYVRAVLKHLEKSPADAKRPIGEVFYEALQAAYPCN
jgi:Rap1a immunity proteins